MIEYRKYSFEYSADIEIIADEVLYDVKFSAVKVLKSEYDYYNMSTTTPMISFFFDFCWTDNVDWRIFVFSY